MKEVFGYIIIIVLLTSVIFINTYTNNTDIEYAANQLIEHNDLLQGDLGVGSLFFDEKLNSFIGTTTSEYISKYPNGKIMEVGNMFNKKLVGNFIQYYDNGNKMKEFKYNYRGLRDGFQTYYREDGSILMNGIWENGKMKELFKYNKKGELVEEYIASIF